MLEHVKRYFKKCVSPFVTVNTLFPRGLLRQANTVAMLSNENKRYVGVWCKELISDEEFIEKFNIIQCRDVADATDSILQYFQKYKSKVMLRRDPDLTYCLCSSDTDKWFLSFDVPPITVERYIQELPEFIYKFTDGLSIEYLDDHYLAPQIVQFKHLKS